MNKWLCVIPLVLAMHGPVQAGLYKCVSATGQVGFQEKPCDSAASQTEIQVKAGPSQQAVQDAEATNAAIKNAGYRFPAPVNQPAGKTRDTAQGSAECEALLASYEREKRAVVEACKRRREIYCDKPPAEIQRLEDEHWMETASMKQLDQYDRVNAGNYGSRKETAIESLERSLKDSKCEYR